MRIGRIIIDTDNMSIEELNTIINELKKIRSRKVKANHFYKEMEALLSEAHNEGFTFIDKDFGNILRSNDFELIDEGEKEDVD